MRVIFIGGLTNGKIVYDYLKSNKYVDLILTITYPDDFSGPRFIQFVDDNNIIKSGTTKGYENLIKEKNPDIIFVAGWSEIISSEILSVPKYGVIGFHPAKLPYDRGRSVLAWQIEEGYTETALTMFEYSEYPDGGDILAQEIIKIEETDYINDILDKIDKATYNIMRAYFPLLRQNLLKREKQNLCIGNFRRLRTQFDSIINWNDISVNIYNKIRAISKPYPGAETKIEKKNMKIWRADILYYFPFGGNTKPGTLVANFFDGTFLIKTRDSFIHILEYDVL